MRSVRLALAVCLIAGQAFAVERDEWGVVVPPAYWAEQPYLSPPAVHRLSWPEVNKACREAFALAAMPLPDMFLFDACASRSPARCDIYVRNDVPVARRNSLLAHEDAHCRGWPADHPLPSTAGPPPPFPIPSH